MSSSIRELLTFCQKAKAFPKEKQTPELMMRVYSASKKLGEQALIHTLNKIPKVLSYADLVDLISLIVKFLALIKIRTPQYKALEQLHMELRLLGGAIARDPDHKPLALSMETRLYISKIFHGEKLTLVDEEIGDGHLGSVKIATLGDTEYAVKQLIRADAESVALMSHEEMLKAEMAGHPGISTSVIAAPLEGNSLQERAVGSISGLHLTESEGIDFTIQITKAIGYMHSLGILHCDIKPGNILIFEGDIFKLNDFDLSIRKTDRDPDKVWGSKDFWAPELWARLGASEASDLYALGATLFLLMTGNRYMPYPGHEARLMHAKMGETTQFLETYVKPESAKHPESKIWPIILSLLDPDTERRKSPIEILDRLETGGLDG